MCWKAYTNKAKRFFIVIQHCLFLLLLYKNGLIIIDKSVKNEPCNEYSNKGDYEYYSFNEVCGDDDLGSFVCYNWSLPIIPTTDLIELVKNKFKTPEQRRFEEELQIAKETLEETRNTLTETKKSLNTSQKALKVSKRSFWIALATLLGTIIFGVWQKCSQQEIDSEQINSVVSAIKEHKTVTIDSIKTLPNDTFNVNIIQPKAKPAPKPTQNPLKQPLPNNWYVRTATNNGD